MVVMGVSGCGKSSLGQALALARGQPFIEGDAHHGPSNLAKMAAGQPLTDEDRLPWLRRLATEMADQPQGAVLSCSALKRHYRDLLRAAVPDLCFVWLEISQADALARVARRGSAHFFDPGLVASQFASLEPPLGEADVIALDARLELPVLCALALQTRPA